LLRRKRRGIKPSARINSLQILRETALGVDGKNAGAPRYQNR